MDWHWDWVSFACGVSLTSIVWASYLTYRLRVST